MAKVGLELTSRVEIGNVDQVLIIKDNADHVIGKLKFSKGSVEWWPKGNKVNAHKYRWDQFAAALEGAKPTVRVPAKKTARKASKAATPQAATLAKRIVRKRTNAQ